MSRAYRPIPIRPMRGGRFPEGVSHLNACPICGAHWKSVRAYGPDKNDANSNGGAKPLPYPHFAFWCGGVYRDLGNDCWEGRCGEMKTKQLELELTE